MKRANNTPRIFARFLGGLLLALVFYFPICIYAQSFRFEGNRNRETLSFEIVKNLMIIQMKVNDKGPFNFVLDTGVGLFLITDPSLIDSVDIRNLRSVSIQGFGDGEPLNAFVAPSVKVSVGNSTASGITAAVLQEDIFELSNYIGMPIHGLIGYEFFSSFVVRLNFPLKTITIHKHNRFTKRKGVKIPITIEDRKPYVQTEIETEFAGKINAKMIIDTGAGHPISLESYNGSRILPPVKSIPGNLGVGLSGPISGRIGRVQSFKIGRFRFPDVITAFPEFENSRARLFAGNRNGNIGLAVLRRLDVVFDYSQLSLYLRQGPGFNAPFEHDMSGLEMSSVGEKFERLIVTRVEPGSAAEEAGIRQFDEILSINLRPVMEFSASEIDDMFRSKPDRSFIIDLLPFGSTDSRVRERTILTLRRRI